MSTPLPPSAYESKAHVPIAAVVVTLTIATTAVSLRTYTRGYIIRQFGMDDWAAIVALVFAMASGIMVATNSIYGAGRHIAVVDPELIPKYFRTFWISIVLYNCSLTAIKMTFLFQYYRVLGTKMKNYIIAATVFVLLWSISQLLVVIFTCVPVHKFWMPETPGTCVELVKFWYANAAGNIVTDVLIFVLPLPAIGGLKLRKPQKIMLLGVFCLGFFTCAISVVRIQFLRLSPDTTWDNVASSCWSIAELCSGITCACLPTLRPLLSRLVPSLRTQGSKSSGYKEQSSGRDGPWSKDSELSSSRSRAVVYPEDIELQPTESEEKLNMNNGGVDLGLTHTRTRSFSQYPEKILPSGNNLGMSDFGVERPTVHTEIRAGTPRLNNVGWPRPLDGGSRGIEVKRDVTLSSF